MNMATDTERPESYKQETREYGPEDVARDVAKASNLSLWALAYAVVDETDERSESIRDKIKKSNYETREPVRRF
jgi:hypothetical protein